jgi:hypothetical protein
MSQKSKSAGQGWAWPGHAWAPVVPGDVMGNPPNEMGRGGHAWAQQAPMAMPVRRWPCFIYNTYSRKKVIFILFLGCCTTSKLAVAPSLDVVRVYIGTSLIKRLTTACIEPIPCRIHVCSCNYLSIMFNISTHKDRI